MFRFLICLLCFSIPQILCAEDPSPPLRKLTNSVGIELIELPVGTFLRGASKDDPDAGEDEFPVTEIRISKPLWFGKYEITQAQFERVMGHNPAWFGPQGPARGIVRKVPTENWPLDNASWKDAVEFCRRLSRIPEEKKTGRTYRLPTESEWEYACRAGTTTRFSYADHLSTSDARFGDTSPHGHPLPVGSFPPNPWGLHDMHGNVWEWCSDRYSPDAYSTASTGSQPEIPGSTARVVRGGDWRATAAFCRSSNRDLTRESRRDVGNGFRILCEVAPPR